MKNIQVNKDKATLLQQHLKQDGVTLARSRALNIVAQLDGYRSHTVAKHGRQHAKAQTAAASPTIVLYSGTFLHPDVEASYVANQGRHCPYCGSHALNDALDASADVALWDVRMGCGDCGKTWFAVYTLDRIDGVHVPATALQDVREGKCSCAVCGGNDAEYSTFVPGREGYQMALCKHFQETCVHVYRLTGMAETEETLRERDGAAGDDDDDAGDEPRYLVSECWGHLFGPGSSETDVRFVYDRKTERIIAMQAQNAWKWVDCSAAETADVEDSLKTANHEALEDPEAWDLEETDELPAWAQPLVGRS